MLRPGTEITHTIIITGKSDLRKGIDGLVAYVRLSYGLDPLEKGTLFLFCGTRKDRIKALLYEGDGFVLLYKRLTNGTFQWPRDRAEALALTQEQFSLLMDGFAVESSIKKYR